MKNILQKLQTATPKVNVIAWLLISLSYALTLIINEQFDLIHAFHFQERTENLLKLLGAMAYILLTGYHFQKVQQKEEFLDDTAATPTP